MRCQSFAALATLLRARSGLCITRDKIYLVRARLEPVARENGFDSLDALVARLHAPAAEPLIACVVEAMTINETLFFRNGRPFEHLARVALPLLIATRPPGQALRIWSAAASTGQEAYSIAMTVADLAPLPGGRRVEIVASDIAAAPIARARAGLYTGFEVQRGLPPALLARHFRQDGALWQISAPLRRAVAFRVFNLLDDPRPLGRFDIVFCRNVLLYFDTETKIRVLALLRRVMPPDGLLYLGGAETVIGLGSGFAPLGEEAGIYTCTTSIAPSLALA